MATDFPEIRRIVRKNDVGVLVPANDPTSLAHALNVLVSDGSLREAYAENARSTAATLNWEEQEARLTDLYKKVLSSDSLALQARS